MRRVQIDCRATIGADRQPAHANTRGARAVRNAWKGIRPHNRGVSLNPVDHPMGFGEGRSSLAATRVTPWGQKTKGAQRATTSDRRWGHEFISAAARSDPRLK